jgi:NAD(P)-dependent dehydrogenase (short-subunit alcohol dehydrogenase family)
VIAAAKALGFRPNDATDDSEREAQHVESPALVTGANKGIGHEVARQLGSMGFHVLVGDANSENGQMTTEALRKTGATATFISLGVSDPEALGRQSILFLRSRTILTSSSTMEASSSKETTRLLSLTRTPNSPHPRTVEALLHRMACLPRSISSAEITRQQVSRLIAFG